MRDLACPPAHRNPSRYSSAVLRLRRAARPFGSFVPPAGRSVSLNLVLGVVAFLLTFLAMADLLCHYAYHTFPSCLRPSCGLGTQPRAASCW